MWRDFMVAGSKNILALCLRSAAFALGLLACSADVHADEGPQSPFAQNSPAKCADGNACVDAIILAAREGRDVDQLLLVAQLNSQNKAGTVTTSVAKARRNRDPELLDVGNVDAILTSILLANRDDFGVMPEWRRALALAYVKANQIDAAESELREGIRRFPTHAPYWADLAIPLSQKGKHDEAVGALVVAASWSNKPAALREAYQRASQKASIVGMEGVYRDALQVIDANKAAQIQLESTLPPISRKPEKDAKAVAPSADFRTCTKPEWPRSSLRYEETGTVTLAFFVNPDGRILRAKILQSSGHVELDNAAFAGIANCRFKPASVDGKPTPAWAMLQYVWALE
jgi:TonB family protein